MKKVVWVFIVFALLWGLWMGKRFLVELYLSKELNTQVSIGSLSWNRNQGFILENFLIYNPPGSKTEKAFSVEFFSINLPLHTLWKNRIEIASVHLKNISLDVEFFDEKETLSNWSHFFQEDTGKNTGKKSIFIQALLLENLEVTITSHKGDQKKYPPIKSLKLQDISSEDFPIGEIESAILKEILKSALHSLGIKPLLKTLNPQKWLPKRLNPFSSKKTST